MEDGRFFSKDVGNVLVMLEWLHLWYTWCCVVYVFDQHLFELLMVTE